MNVGDLVILCSKAYEPEFVQDWGVGMVVTYSDPFRTADVFWFKKGFCRVFIDVVLEVL